jgi:hypothetical protein
LLPRDAAPVDELASARGHMRMPQCSIKAFWLFYFGHFVARIP